MCVVERREREIAKLREGGGERARARESTRSRARERERCAEKFKRGKNIEQSDLGV